MTIFEAVEAIPGVVAVVLWVGTAFLVWRARKQNPYARAQREVEEHSAQLQRKHNRPH